MTTTEPRLFATLLRDTNYFFDRKIGEGSSGMIVLGHSSTASLPSCLLASRSLPVRLSSIENEFNPSKNVSSKKATPRSACRQQEAIKIFHLRNSHYYWREKRALQKLKGCDNVIVMKKGFANLHRSYIVMEKCQTDLSEIVSQEGHLNEDLARMYFRQMANGLISAPGNSFCHHDVKLENFLVSKDREVKLADFGYSVSMEEDTELTQTIKGRTYIKGQYSAGSPAYSSPQVLFRLPHLPEPTDIYGLGVCLYVMLCGTFPFCNPQFDSRETLKHNVITSFDQSSISFPPHVSCDAQEMICGMLSLKESERWDWERIINHNWCSGY